jgi:hypothetical protein
MHYRHRLHRTNALTCFEAILTELKNCRTEGCAPGEHLSPAKLWQAGGSYSRSTYLSAFQFSSNIMISAELVP